MKRLIRKFAAAGILASAMPLAAAQSPSLPASPPGGISDLGSFGALPYEALARPVLLRPEEKQALRRLEDKHIQERRALEDRYEQELRALQAKQYAEREAFFKSLAPR